MSLPFIPGDPFGASGIHSNYLNIHNWQWDQIQGLISSKSIVVRVGEAMFYLIVV